MGGYSSFPICIAGSILRIRFVIYESNLLIGKSNDFCLLQKNICFLQSRSVSKKYKNKVIEIGNLIREEILNFSTGSEKTEINNLKILVLGGSQGAKVFADELPQIFKKCKSQNYQLKFSNNVKLIRMKVYQFIK